MAKSLDATSTTIYYPAQIRCNTSLTVRLQVPSLLPSLKTVYQSSDHISVPVAFKAWVQKLPHTHASLSGGSKSVYAPCQVRAIDGQTIQVQIPGPEYNRPYGAAFSFVSAPLAQHLGAKA